MFKKNKISGKKMALGAGVAAGLGYLAGILTAPKSGKQTRRMLKSDAKKAIRKAEKEVKHVHSEVDKAVAQLKAKGASSKAATKQQADELVKKAQDGKAKSAEVLKALKSGKAKDEDLNQAMADAKKAVSDIAKFLKK